MINDQCVCAGTPIVTYDCEELQANIGDTCNDNDASTENDVINDQCVCAGTPTNCTEQLQLTIKLDTHGAETSWELRDANSQVVSSGGPYTSGQAATVTEAICVPQGCYSLVVNDAGANGITNGGYVLSYPDGRRIIDAATGLFNSASQVQIAGNPMTFCLPLGISNMLAGTCDKPSRRISAPVYASNYGPTASQYQFWIFDPHGTYSRRVATVVPQFTPGDLNTSPVPANTELNICVRVMVGGVYRPFGPVCRYFFTPNTTSPSMVLAGDLEITLYPNPNRTGLVNLDLQGLQHDGTPVNVEIHDAMGRLVHGETIHGNAFRSAHLIDLQGRTVAGMYLVSITANGQRYTHRLVLE